MNTTDTDTAALLDAAADYIEAHGWCQGDLYDHYEDLADPPGACALGALYITAWGAPVEALCHRDPGAFRRVEAAAALVVDTLGVVRDDRGRGEAIYPADELVWWNDGHNRTGQQVIDTFRCIAAAHRNERAS